MKNSVTLHDITRTKELVEIFYKQEFGITYADILHLRDFWTLCDLENAKSVLVNQLFRFSKNDDFRNDTLTGAVF